MMSNLAMILVTALLITTVGCASKPTCSHDESSFRCVEYVKNYDADTITFSVPNTHPIIGKNISIRVLGVDTPEIRTKNKCEKELALVAKRAVTQKMKKAKRVDLEKVSRGKYFRIVADVKVDGESLTDFLLSNNLAYPYDGGTKNKVNWCKQSQRVPSSLKLGGKHGK